MLRISEETALLIKLLYGATIVMSVIVTAPRANATAEQDAIRFTHGNSGNSASD